MSNIDGFKKQIANITTWAHEMRSVLIDPIVDDGGKIIAAPRTRAARLKGAVANSLYESAGEHAEMIVGAHSRSLRAYCERYDRMPSDEVLASAHQAIENALVVGRKGDGAPSGIGVFENADMSTTEGIMMRDRMVSLVLPVMLMSVTSQMVTLISGEVKSQEGLVGFQNLDGLRNLFHKYVNVKTVKDVDGEIHVPAAEEHEENVPISEEQEKLYQTLRKRAKKAAMPGPKEAGDSIFSIIRDMDRLTTDIDMFRHLPNPTRQCFRKLR